MILDQSHLHILLAQIVFTLAQATLHLSGQGLAGQCMNEAWVARGVLGLLGAFAI